MWDWKGWKGMSELSKFQAPLLQHPVVALSMPCHVTMGPSGECASQKTPWLTLMPPVSHAALQTSKASQAHHRPPMRAVWGPRDAT